MILWTNSLSHLLSFQTQKSSSSVWATRKVRPYKWNKSIKLLLESRATEHHEWERKIYIIHYVFIVVASPILSNNTISSFDAQRWMKEAILHANCSNSFTNNIFHFKNKNFFLVPWKTQKPLKKLQIEGPEGMLYYDHIILRSVK